MSHDFILGSTDLDWSRGSDVSEGIVISDKEIKESMVGHHRHHHHRRGQWQPGQIPGQYPGQTPGQYPGQYQGQPTGTVRPDPQKLQLLRSTYRQIRDGHSNWLINQDHQNNNWATPASTYQQAAKLWARQQLQQQQLPVRSDPTTYSQWQQPLSWFQTQTQAALNSAAGQMATSITTTQQSTPYTPPVPVSQYAPPSITTPTAPQNVYYPSPGDDSYDDDSGRDSFVSDEARAEGENRSTRRQDPHHHQRSCGDDLPHSTYRALVMKQAIKNAGGKNPSTKHLFAAKKAVDSALGKSGTGIYIPGATPRRRTV